MFWFSFLRSQESNFFLRSLPFQFSVNFFYFNCVFKPLKPLHRFFYKLNHVYLIMQTVLFQSFIRHLFILINWNNFKFIDEGGASTSKKAALVTNPQCTYMLFTDLEVRIGRTRDRGHSFSQYGPTKAGKREVYFQMLKRRCGTRLFPKRLVWSERTLILLHISEIKFLGK